MRQWIRLGRSASNASDSTAASMPAPPPFSLLRAMLRTLLLLLLVAAVVYWLICALGAITAHDLGNDFLVYFSAALALRDNPHAAIFDLHTLQIAAAAHGAPTPTLLYLYPPLLAILLIPLTLLPYHVALFTWTLLNLTLWACGTAILIQWAWAILGVAPSMADRRAGEHETHERQRTRQDLALFASTVTVLLSASFFPMLFGVINGQVTSLIFVLSLVALALLTRHPRLAGASLALATWIKLLPVVLVGYFLLRRRWRVIEGTALAAVLLGALTLLVVGWPGLLASTSIVANGSAMADVQHANWNLTLAQVPLWIALALGGEPSHILTLLGTTTAAAVVALFAAGVFFSQRNSTRDEREMPQAGHPYLVDLLGMSWALCTMVLLSPVAWMHTYAWLLPPVIICLSVALRALIESHRSDTGMPPVVRMNHPYAAFSVLIVLLVAYAALAIPAYTQRAPDISLLLHRQPMNLPLLLLHPVGALLLWGANGLLFLRSVRCAPQPAIQGIAARPGASNLPIPSARFLALALIALLIVVGAVEVLYWSIFVIVSTH